MLPRKQRGWPSSGSVAVTTPAGTSVRVDEPGRGHQVGAREQALGGVLPHPGERRHGRPAPAAEPPRRQPDAQSRAPARARSTAANTRRLRRRARRWPAPRRHRDGRRARACGCRPRAAGGGWRAEPRRAAPSSALRSAVGGGAGTGTRGTSSTAASCRSSASIAAASAGRAAGSRRVARCTNASSSGGTSPGDLRRRRDVAVDVPVGHRDRGVAGVRRCAGEQLVEQDARGVDVAAGVGRAGGDLLGRQVRDRAQDRARVAGARLRRRDREPEVGDLRLAAPSEISTFSGLTSRCTIPSRCASASPDSTCSMTANAAGTPSGAAGAQHVAQRAAVDQLHDEEQPVAVDCPGRGRRRRRGGRCGPPSAPPARSACGTPGRPRTARP